MSKNLKIIVFSLIALAVLGGVAAVLMLTAPKTDDKSKENDIFPSSGNASTGAVLCERNENEVTSIDVVNAEGSYTIVPSGQAGDGGIPVWTIDGFTDAPLNKSSLSSAVGNVVRFDTNAFVEEAADSSALAKYGLDAPKTAVTAKFTDGTEFSFKVGNDTPNSSTVVYVTADGKNVYTCYKNRTEAFFGDELGFVSLAAMPEFNAAEGMKVNKLTISRRDLEEPIIIESIVPKDENDIQAFSYRFTSPYTAYADLDHFPKFLFSLFGISASSCEWVGMDDRSREIAGLNDPNCTMVIETNLGTYTLTIGNATVENYTDENGEEKEKITGFYGESSEVPGVLYKFGTGSVPALTVTLNDITSQSVVMPYIYSVSTVKYRDKDGRTLDIGIETIPAKSDEEEDVHKYTVNGEPAEEQRVKDIYQFFITAAGDELYFGSEKGDFIAEIEYTYLDPSDGTDGKEILRFYSSQTDRKTIVEVNGKNMYKTRQMYTTQLLANITRFYAGEKIVDSY